MWKRVRDRVASLIGVYVASAMTIATIVLALAAELPWLPALAIVCGGLTVILIIVILSWRDERAELAARIAELTAVLPMPPAIRQEFRDLMRVAGLMNESVRGLGANPHRTFAAEASKLIVDFGDLIGAFGEWPAVRRCARDFCQTSSVVVARATGLDGAVRWDEDYVRRADVEYVALLEACRAVLAQHGERQGGVEGGGN